MNEFNKNNDQVNQQPTQTQLQQVQVEIGSSEKSRGFAIASMVVGTVSMFFSVCAIFIYAGVFTLVCSVAGLIFGIISLVKKLPGKGMAVTGVILSGIATLLSIIAIVHSVQLHVPLI